jgi:hypothetical protein
LLSLLLPQNVSAERAIKEEGGKEEEGEEKKEKGTKQNKKKNGTQTDGRTGADTRMWKGRLCSGMYSSPRACSPLSGVGRREDDAWRAPFPTLNDTVT